MSILDRYIAQEFWKGLLAAMITFLVLYLGGDTLRQGLGEEVPPQYIFQYTLYQLPEVIVLLLPAACLMATLLCLSGFSRRNELIAMFASGISLARIAFVLLCLVFMLCCLSFIVTDRIVPPLTKMRAHFYRTVIQKRPDLETDIRQSKVWYHSKNMIYNLRTFDSKKNQIEGLSVYSFDGNFDLIQQIEAQKAVYQAGRWVLLNGLVTIFDGNPLFPLTKHFDQQSISLQERPEDFKEIDKEVETLRLKNLWRFISRNKAAGIDTHSFEVTFWSKISMAFVSFIMALLGIPFATQHQRHSSLARDISVCFMIVVLYWLFFSTALSMGKSGWMNPFLAAWLPTFTFLGFGLFLIMRNKKV